VRKLLAEHGLEASDVQGSGRDGRLTRRDVLAHVKGAPAPAPARAPAGKSPVGKSEVIPFSRIRKRTAEHMVRSKATSPHVLQAVEVEFHQVDAARTTKGKAWRAREGFTLTYLPFIARATCLAIPEFPRVNATVDGESLVVHGGINLAIAVDLGFDGLVAPVIPDAHAKSVADLAYEIHALAKKARAGRLSPDDVAGATYTLSNSGSFGTLITAPIINQPQVAILSADGVRKKPVVVEGEAGDAIAIRPVGILAQSFDHRAMDGAYSAAFLRRLKEIIETTDWTAELN
jgi:2-oxoglutarate dehydrogenase E2 component (dihydrolipoamide succinyltransferase)